MESRIKQLRENRGLIQEILASELGITQQMLSKYERDVLCIKVDVLKRIPCRCHPYGRTPRKRKMQA